jgi:hypothetical protein
MSALQLPASVSQSGYRILVPAIREAIDFHDLQQPIWVKLTGGIVKKGAHRWDPHRRMHIITVSTHSDVARASVTLWHELTHAAQSERLGPDDFRTMYAADRRARGYRYCQFEVEARETADLMHPLLPLTRAA